MSFPTFPHNDEYNFADLNLPQPPKIPDFSKFAFPDMHSMFGGMFPAFQGMGCPFTFAMEAFGFNTGSFRATIIDMPESPDDIDFPEQTGNGIPTAVFHGMGDACVYGGMRSIDKMISKGTGAYVKCIEVGLPTFGEVLANMETVAETTCEKVKADKHFQGEFNVMGLSQGGLLARYIVEECDMPGTVRNVLTLGGPHMGVDGIPNCPSGMMCDIMNFIAKRFVYMKVVQDHFAPAGYFRNVNNMKAYEDKAVFLPALNNEMPSDNGKAGVRKQAFSDINAMMAVMFSEDTMLNPKETAWFQQYDKKGNVQPLKESEFYLEDKIGLKTLMDADKVQFVQFEGNHLQFTTEDINNTLIPFLMS